MYVSVSHLFLAENACDVNERQQCDGGNERSVCAHDAVNGGIICQCPKGYALNATMFCVGKLILVKIIRFRCSEVSTLAVTCNLFN